MSTFKSKIIEMAPNQAVDLTHQAIAYKLNRHVYLRSCEGSVIRREPVEIHLYIQVNVIFRESSSQKSKSTHDQECTLKKTLEKGPF